MRHSRTFSPASFSARLGLCLALGCASVAPIVPVLPVDHATTVEQLAIHSDFQLPPQHRLLEDLRLERGEVYGKLNLPPSDEPIYVYLFENEGKYQSFLKRNFPNFPTRRAFFVESDTRLAVYAHWGDRVAEDLRHEVAHGYIHAVAPTVPLWLDEGLAEYFEAPRVQSGFNRPHVELLIAELHENTWRPDLFRLEQLSSAGEMKQRDYAEAWAWAHWLLETTPKRRDLLQGQILLIHQGVSTQPLSQVVRQAEPQAEHVLTQHIFEMSRSL